MRYMFLIYSRESDYANQTTTELQAIREAHWAVIEDAKRQGILEGCSPLQNTPTATTVRMEAGKPLVLDGPFAETKEQLAGYYILNCKDLDEAIAWAARIPSCCKGGEGCVEIRPLADIPQR
jgi:hypothetical protein